MNYHEQETKENFQHTFHHDSIISDQNPLLESFLPSNIVRESDVDKVTNIENVTKW